LKSSKVRLPISWIGAKTFVVKSENQVPPQKDPRFHIENSSVTA